MEIRFRPERLIAERRILAMTQAELAAKAGIAPATLSRIEGGRQEPHPTTVRRLAVALGIMPGLLVTYDAAQIGGR